MHQCDSNAFHTIVAQHGHQRTDAFFIQIQQHITLGVAALQYGQAQIAGHQGYRFINIDVVLVKAVLVAHLDRVTETFGNDQGGFGALALDHRVRG